jgi:hypothetical protein
VRRHDDPDIFPSCREAYERHDKTCESLGEMWMGRGGGVSCPSDLTTCYGCDVMFYNEGVTRVENEDCDIYLCECCSR